MRATALSRSILTLRCLLSRTQLEQWTDSESAQISKKKTKRAMAGLPLLVPLVLSEAEEDSVVSGT